MRAAAAAAAAASSSSGTFDLTCSIPVAVTARALDAERGAAMIVLDDLSDNARPQKVVAARRCFGYAVANGQPPAAAAGSAGSALQVALVVPVLEVAAPVGALDEERTAGAIIAYDDANPVAASCAVPEWSVVVAASCEHALIANGQSATAAAATTTAAARSFNLACTMRRASRFCKTASIELL